MIYNTIYERKSIILLSVWQGDLPPYMFGDLFYCLQEGELSVKKANVKDTEHLFENRKNIDNNWERRLTSATVEDLNIDLVTNTMSKYPSLDNASSDYVEFLMSRGLVRQGMATNACVIMFGKNPSQFFPQSMIRLFIYDEKNELKKTYHYSHCLLESIPLLFEQLGKLYWSEYIIESLERKEKKNYPDIAIREAILNACIHRIYDSPQSFVNISLYANRIEIVNYGSLPAGIKQSDLKKNHLSILRNPDIAYICNLNEYIEMAGSGTLRILKDCKENGFVEPKWTCNDHSVKITFPGIMMRQPSKSKLSLTESCFANMSADKRVDLMRIVDFIKANPNSKIHDIASLVNKSTATIKRYVVELQNLALIKYVGGKKFGGYYIVVKDE